MQEICWSLQYWLSHIIFTEICRISEKSLSSFSMLGIFERTSVSQILYGLYHCGAQTHQISTMPQSSSACWGQDRCRTPAADPDAQHPLAEAYPSLIPVSLGQDQDLNAPSSPGTASCSTSTFCTSQGDSSQGSAASWDRATAAFLVFRVWVHFEVWASSVEECPGGGTGTGSAGLNIWRGNATEGHKAEHLYHVVCHFEDGQCRQQLLSCRISPEGLAPSVWI